MPISVTKDTVEGPLSRELEALADVRVRECYQCGKCSAGCPVADEMDILPNRIVRLAQLGEFEKALRSKTIWLCASCITCTTRCPREVDIAAVMDALREMSLEKGLADPASKEIVSFHKAFLDTVRAFGRMSEFPMVGDYKLRSLKLFQDILAAPKMFLRGKLRLIPKRIKGRGEVRKIFSKCGW